MKITQVTITPEAANDLLKLNTMNRPMSKTHLSHLTAMLLRGEWVENGDAIRISKCGKLIDGQHRLLAVIKSGTEHKFLVARQLDSDVFDVLDTGKSRSASDVLSIDGFYQPELYASLSKRIIEYKNGVLDGVVSGGDKHSVRKKSFTGKTTNTDVLEFSRNNDLVEHVKFGAKAYKELPLYSKTDYAFLHWMFNSISETDCRVFFEKLVGGVNLSKTDPILLLRNKMIENIASSIKFSSKMKTALTFKTWNHFREGNEMKILQYFPDHAMPVPK